MPAQYLADDLRYLRHPAPGSSQLQDGDAYDAGSLHILDNNCTVLWRESTRHLVTDAWDASSFYGDGYDGLSDGSKPDGATSVDLIAWTTDVATEHPFAASLDAEAPTGLWLPRPIEYRVYGYKSGAGGSFAIYVALTFQGDIPTTVGALARQSHTVSAAGATGFASTLTSSYVDPIQSANWPCRPRSQTYGATTARVYPLSIWVGVDTSGLSSGTWSIASFSAWEARRT